MPASSASDFRALVDRHFGSLLAGHGFQQVETPASDTVREYRASHMALLIGFSRGELDVLVQVLIETAILRPYRTRIFPLEKVARRIDPHAYDRCPVLTTTAPSLAEIEPVLAFHARILATMASRVLEGDVTPCEAIANGL